MADNQFINPAALHYKFHDTVLEQFQFDSTRGRLLLTIFDKHADNNEIVRIELIISGISNSKEVDQIQGEIRRILVKQKRALLNYRIDQLEFHKNKNNEDNQLCIQLFVDHLAPLVIKCIKVTGCIIYC